MQFTMFSLKLVVCYCTFFVNNIVPSTHFIAEVKFAYRK